MPIVDGLDARLIWASRSPDVAHFHPAPRGPARGAYEVGGEPIVTESSFAAIDDVTVKSIEPGRSGRTVLDAGTRCP